MTFMSGGTVTRMTETAEIRPAMEGPVWATTEWIPEAPDRVKMTATAEYMYRMTTDLKGTRWYIPASNVPELQNLLTN
jgi:hypothetical protein